MDDDPDRNLPREDAATLRAQNAALKKRVDDLESEARFKEAARSGKRPVIRRLDPGAADAFARPYDGR